MEPMNFVCTDKDTRFSAGVGHFYIVRLLHPDGTNLRGCLGVAYDVTSELCYTQNKKNMDVITVMILCVCACACACVRACVY